MTCPHCNHRFPLTWKRYAKAPGGRHTCPACQRKSRFPWSLPYFLCLLIGYLVLGVLCRIYFGQESGLSAMLFIGLLVGIPIDKYHDENFRKLRAYETPAEAVDERFQSPPSESRLRDVSIIALIVCVVLGVIFIVRFIGLNIPPLF